MNNLRTPPSNLRSLETRIANVAKEQGRPIRRVQRAVANTVIGQMLPPGVVKGGTAIKLRVGEGRSRFTLDFDAARHAEVELDDYLDQLAERLMVGWDGFTGTVEELEAARPFGIPDEYVMQPFVIRLAFRGRHWLSVTFELGRDATGIGGQPVVQPGGTVIVPIDNANETALLAFKSTDGGVTWSATTAVTSISTHAVAGNLRTGALPSAEIDGVGKVYVVWQDCRFRRGCKSNDIVMTTSTDGTTWTPVVRIPIDATGSKVDHFIPGLAVDPSSSGVSAKLGLAYYYYPTSNCSASTCQLTAASSRRSPVAAPGRRRRRWARR